MFEFSLVVRRGREAGTLAGRPRLWSASLRSWDLCFEMDEQDRVIRVGGRQAYRLQCAHGLGEQPRPFAEYLERRAPVRRRWPACAGASVST